MTPATNARLAGVAYLVYIVSGIASMALKKPTTDILAIVTSLCALILAVTLYAITRHVDRDLAMLALTCRVIEAIPGPHGAVFFAIGSTIFCWLFLRGRIIPVALAWLGVIASALLVLILPMQRAGVFAAATSWSSKLTWLMWMPALVFEIALALWLLIKGVAVPVDKAPQVG